MPCGVRTNVCIRLNISAPHRGCRTLMGFKSPLLPLHIHCLSAQRGRRFDSMIYLSPPPSPATGPYIQPLKTPHHACLPPSYSSPLYKYHTQLRPVHDGIDVLIPGLQTRAGFLTRHASKSINLLVNCIHTQMHTPVTVLFRHKIGHIVSNSFVQCCV